MDLLTSQAVQDLANQIQLCQLAKNRDNRSDMLVRLWVEARKRDLLELVEVELFRRSGYPVYGYKPLE